MKDDAIYLEHIIDCIDRINEYTENDQFVFMNSQMVQDAVIRNLQTLAESTQKLSEELKARHPDINWKAISGFRNIIIGFGFAANMAGYRKSTATVKGKSGKATLKIQ